MKPIKPLRERKKPGSLTQAELYAQVKDSTERNRQFFFIWIAFALYVIVTTVATTDLQLLLPNSRVTLPALGIQLPLIGFFLVTPWLVLVLHFNLLQNLDSHSNKLAEWANTYPNQNPPRSAVPAFLFDFAMLEQGGSFPKITQTAAQIAFYAMGPVTIGILLCRFNDYQELAYTSNQLLAFILNLYIVAGFTRSLTRKHRINTSVAQFSYIVAYVPVIAMVVLQVFWAGWLALKDDEPPLFGNLKYEFLLPRIKIPPDTSLVTLPVDLTSRMALDGEKDVAKWWSKYGIGADLRYRKLKYAQLDEIDMRKVNFAITRLQGADLSRSQLQGADFRFAELQGASLSLAQLQGADFRAANLQRTDLKDIKINTETVFRPLFSNSAPLIFVGEDYYPEKEEEVFPEHMIIDAKKTFAFREQLDSNGLRLPSILYLQLFESPTKHAVKNSKQEVVVSVGVGLRDLSAK